VVDDAYLNLFDGYWVLVYAKYASSLAGCWAETASKFWEVVCRMKTVKSFAPPIAVNQVIPIWNYVSERTAVIAERDPAVHASACLLFQSPLIKVFIDLLPIEKTDWYRPS
tara:strand:- start:15148 stop:15480 length:333 start_codon:yes stop_codon:yes gene_type:complete